MAYSKIIYGGNVLIDLTGDTVAADKMLAGITAHGKDGEEVTGTCAYDAATGDALRLAAAHAFDAGVTITALIGAALVSIAAIIAATTLKGSRTAPIEH